VATIEVEDDIDGGPLGGCYQRVQQRPPPKLNKMLMMGPLGVLLADLEMATTEVELGIDGSLWTLPRHPDPIICLDAYWFLQV
jgi:hypothetical protein